MRYAPLFLILALAACGVSPEPDDYVLTAVDGKCSPEVLEIKVQRPSLPDYLDRPQMVRMNGNNYESDEYHRWAEPLDRMFERVLAEDLRQRLPNSHILSESDTGMLANPIIVETAIEQFNADGSHATMRTILSMQDKVTGDKPMSKVDAQTGINGSPSSLAVSLSDFIGVYADKVVQELQRIAKDRQRAQP